MNLGSEGWGEGGAGADALALDYARLIASLAAVQAATRTAMTDLQDPDAAAATDPVAALVTLFAVEPGWGGAVAALGGSFSPAVAQAIAGPAHKPR